MVERLTMSSHPVDGGSMDVHPHGDYVLYSDYAELEAEVERLKDRLGDPDGTIAHADAIISQAATLSRTGAVKAGLEKAAEIVLAQIDSKPDWTPEQEKELRGHDPVATARSAARVAIRQCHRAILSALEPHPRDTNTVDSHETANVSDKQEGQQEPVAFMHPTGAMLRAGNYPSGVDFTKYGWAPLYTRPSEQAVTEAMVEAALKSLHENPVSWESRSAIRSALKAAMEAGG